MPMEMRQIEIDRIRPNYRLVFDDETICLLCHDIRCRGLLEPLVVELVEWWFELVDGEKRWRACKRLGMRKVAATIAEESLT